MAYIATIPRRRAQGALRQTYDDLRDLTGSGMSPAIMEVFSLRQPTMASALRAWHTSMWVGTEPRVPREFLAAAVSRLNDCTY